MTTAEISLVPKLIPVFEGEADTRGAFGGRGSGKTRSFALMAAVKAHMWDMAGREGIILCGRQFMNSLDESSMEEVKAAIRSTDWLEPHFDIGEKYIRTASGRVSFKFAGLDRNVDSIKSKSRVLLCWVDEAEPVTDDAWTKLEPTLREEDSELWVTWNPERKNSATHKRYRLSRDPRTKIVECNWRDNPRFPKILERKRVKDQNERPDQYNHIWEGDFKSVVEGAYYAKHITKAKADKRIGGHVGEDPLMTTYAIWDIGGTGAKADACAIWIVQFIGKEIRFLDYYEAQGQPLDVHVSWLRKNGYEDTHCVLPHDGETNDRVYDVSYESALKQALFEVTVIPNQGKGAAMARVERARQLFPQMWFDNKCQAGIDAIGWYHAKIDEKREIDLGPEHDWSSHGADAFGLAAVFYKEPTQPRDRDPRNSGPGGWMQ